MDVSDALKSWADADYERRRRLRLDYERNRFERRFCWIKTQHKRAGHYLRNCRCVMKWPTL